MPSKIRAVILAFIFVQLIYENYAIESPLSQRLQNDTEDVIDCEIFANRYAPKCQAYFSTGWYLGEDNFMVITHEGETPNIDKKSLLEEIIPKRKPPKKTNAPLYIADKLNDFHKVELNSYVKTAYLSSVNRHLVEKTKQEYQRILSQWGKVSLDFSLSQYFQLATYHFLYLLPIYETHRFLFFHQINYAYNANKENILNLGFAFRSFDRQMLGANAFFDFNLNNKHARSSIGVEAATKDFRFSSNFYMPLTPWKKTGQFDISGGEFLGKPALGYDISLKGYFPYEKTLSGEISFNQWLGLIPEHWNNANIYDAADLKTNRSVLSANIAWKPISFFEATVAYSGILHQKPQLSTTININWNLDERWEKQFTRMHALNKTGIEGMRREFVNRNNYMVMAYKVESGSPYAKTIDFKINTPKKSNRYTSKIGEEVELQLAPITARKQTIPNIADKITITTLSDPYIVTFKKITQSGTPGVYSGWYTGQKIGQDNIQVSYRDMSVKIPIEIESLTKTMDVIPATIVNANNRYQSTENIPVTLQIIAYDNDGKNVSGLSGDLNIELVAGANGLVDFTKSFSEIKNSGIYETTYTGLTTGNGTIKVSHESVKKEFDIEIVSKSNAIDLLPLDTLTASEPFESAEGTTIIMQVIPYGADSKPLSGVAADLNITEVSNSILSFGSGNFTEINTSGVYEAQYSGLSLGASKIKVTHEQIDKEIEVKIVPKSTSIDLLPINALTTSEPYESAETAAITLQVVIIGADGTPLSGVATDLSISEVGNTLLDFGSGTFTEINASGVYEIQYSGIGLGQSKVKVTHEQIENEIEVEIVSRSKTIDLLPLNTLTTSEPYESAEGVPITLQVIPMGPDGNSVPGIAGDLTISESSGTSLLTLQQTFTEINGNGVYETEYTGNTVGLGKIKVVHEQADNEINFEIVPKTKSIELLPTYTLNGQEPYESARDQPITLQVTAIGPDNKPVSGIAGEINITESSGTSLLSLPTSFTELNNSGVYEAQYTGVLTGNCAIEVSHNSAKKEIQLTIVSKTNSIDAFPLNALNSQMPYESAKDSTITLQVIPIGQDGKPVTGLSGLLNIAEVAGPGNLTNVPNGFTEINTTGVYETEYTGVNEGTGQLEITYDQSLFPP